MIIPVQYDTMMQGRTSILIGVFIVLGISLELQVVAAQCVCPSNAAQLCSSQSAQEISSYASQLTSSCGQSDFNPTKCCSLLSSANWDAMAACACSGGGSPGLVGSVNMNTVASICGCPGATASSPPQTNPGQTPAAFDSWFPYQNSGRKLKMV